MGKDKTPSVPRTGAVTNDVAAFLQEVKSRPPVTTGGRGRLIFALDATMSRQPTWDLACAMQADMFKTVAAIGTLEVQLVYFRGFDECRASSWMTDGSKLGALMSKIDCRGGRTQIGRVLRHAVAQTEKGGVGAVVFVGDAMEEAIDALCSDAGPLALRGVPVFLFQEGHDSSAETAFKEIARLTRGAWCKFDAGSADQLRALLNAAASYAAGGTSALKALARSSDGARKLIAAMGSNK